MALPLMERSANGGVELPESRRLPEQSRTAVAEFRWGVDPAERAGEDVLIGFAGDAARPTLDTLVFVDIVAASQPKVDWVVESHKNRQVKNQRVGIPRILHPQARISIDDGGVPRRGGRGWARRSGREAGATDRVGGTMALRRGLPLLFHVLDIVQELFVRFVQKGRSKSTVRRNMLAGARGRARCFNGRLLVCLRRRGCAAAASAMLRRSRRRRMAVSTG